MTSDLQRLCAKLGIRATATYGNKTANRGGFARDDWRASAHPYTVALRFGRRRLTVEFWQGPAHTSEPTAADVLSCVVSDASAGDLSFSEFCSEFGYDHDSRAAEQTHRACARMAPRVRRFLGEAFDRVASTSH